MTNVVKWRSKREFVAFFAIYLIYRAEVVGFYIFLSKIKAEKSNL